MSDSNYSVIFRGDLLPGFTVADVRSNLARLFKTGPETIDKLFSGRPVAIRKGLAQAQAEQFVAAMAKMGAQATVKDESAVAPPPAPRPAEDASEEGAAAASPSDQWTLAPMEGNLVKEHERERKESVQVSVDHLGIAPVGGNLVEDGERVRKPSVQVDVPQWQVN